MALLHRARYKFAHGDMINLTAVQLMFIAVAEQEQAKAEAGRSPTPPSKQVTQPPSVHMPSYKIYTADEYRGVRKTDSELATRAEEIRKESKEKYAWLAELGHLR